jgi:hypothetical protein
MRLGQTNDLAAFYIQEVAMMAEQTFRVVLIMPRPEAEALARIAQREIRNLREQASYLVREALVAHGELRQETPAEPNAEAVFALKGMNA